MTVRVVLVGLPGVGKSTVGSALAVALGVGFVDVDTMVEARTGRTPAALLRERGEEAFREEESLALDAALDVGGDVVIATGGGAVETSTSRARLAFERLVVHLTAPPSALLVRLDGGDRPLVEGPSEERLAWLTERRAPLYAEVADVVVDAAGPVDDVVAAIVRLAVPA